jgi:hypothetical protein
MIKRLGSINSLGLSTALMQEYDTPTIQSRHCTEQLGGTIIIYSHVLDYLQQDAINPDILIRQSTNPKFYQREKKLAEEKNNHAMPARCTR